MTGRVQPAILTAFVDALVDAVEVLAEIVGRMVMTRGTTLLHNRTAQGFVLVGSFICAVLSWMWIAAAAPTWIDWIGFIVATALFFYCLAVTIKGRRLRRQELLANGRAKHS